MSGALVTPSELVVHQCRGLKKSAAEIGERCIALLRNPDDDPSGTKFSVIVDHPKEVATPNGRSKQEPEIVWRGNDEAAAKNAYATYCEILGGSAPTGYKTAAANPREDGKRIASLERELDELRQVVEELRGKKK